MMAELSYTRAACRQPLANYTLAPENYTDGPLVAMK